MSERDLFPRLEKAELASVEEKIDQVSREVCTIFFEVFDVEKILLDQGTVQQHLDDRLVLLEHTMIYQLMREKFQKYMRDFPASLQTDDFVSLLKSATKTRIIGYFKELVILYANDPVKNNFLQECIKKVSFITVDR